MLNISTFAAQLDRAVWKGRIFFKQWACSYNGIQFDKAFGSMHCYGAQKLVLDLISSVLCIVYTYLYLNRAGYQFLIRTTNKQLMFVYLLVLISCMFSIMTNIEHLWDTHIHRLVVNVSLKIYITLSFHSLTSSLCFG